MENKTLSFKEKVELQREFDFWSNQYKKHQQGFIENLDHKEKSNEHAKEMAKIDGILTKLRNELGEPLNRNLRSAIYDGMISENLTEETLAKMLGTTEEIVRDCIREGKFLFTPEHTSFGIEAIELFGLDANRYLAYFRK